MKSTLLAALGVLLLSACSSTPVYAPGILVLPGSAKSFDQFRFDEHECRNYAQAQVAKPGEGDTAGTIQQRYDRAFLQCMYAKGHKVPITGRASDYIDSTAPAAARTPPPAPPAPPAPAAAPPPPPPPAGQPPAEAPPDYRPPPPR